MTGGSETPLLAASGISKRFDALVVLDALDVTLAEGVAVGIVGPNGAGKTTLLSVLAGAVRSDRGWIRLKDRDVTALTAAERCRLGIVRTHQVPRAFADMTVLENVLVGALHGSGLAVPEAEAKAIEALTLCGMRRVANRRAATLGLLDRKRLELTRALATEPALLLLDEIGGGLTDGEASELLETIRQVQGRGVTIVWIEHRVHILTQIVTRLVCMDAGRIIADGTPSAVLNDPAVLDAYFGDSVPCPA